MVELKTFEYADPDFTDFDKEKDESFIKVGKVFAAYDTLDVISRSIQSPGRFLLLILNCA